MSIEGKHAYRFGYLKSEQWQNVRIEALAREKGKCQICAEESISNDAHHVWYPERIYETRADQLVVLCRPCHDFIHTMLPECKTSDEEQGRAAWLKFSNAIACWRSRKVFLFETDELLNFQDLTAKAAPKSLREQLEKVTKALRSKSFVPETVKGKSPEQEIEGVFAVLRKWSKNFLESSTRGKIEVAESDFQI